MPKNFEASYNFMVLLLGSEQPERATPWFMNAYRLRPQGELDLRMSKAADELHRDRPDFLAVLATIDADRGNSVLAEKWARKALELDPNHAASQYILGVLLKSRDEFVEAYDLLHAAADALTDSYEAQMEFGEVLLKTNQELAAKPYLTRALQLLQSQADMTPKLREKTREALETALMKIQELEEQAGPTAPPSDQ
jgi:Tfp pilus assembly protein PilF